MYKGISQGLQKAASKLSLADLQTDGGIVLSESDSARAEQQHLKTLVTKLESRIVALPKGSLRRKELGLEKMALQQKLQKIRARAREEDIALRADNKLENHFVKQAFKLLTRFDFTRIMEAAKKALADEGGEL